MTHFPILVAPGPFSRALEELRALSSAPLLRRAGSRPVLVTSVHGFPHLREGVVKASDSGTLQTSYLLAATADANWVAVGEPELADSNYHRDTAFKQALAAYLAATATTLVIDIHGSQAFRPYDVEIGSLDQQSWLGQEQWRESLTGYLERCGFFVSDNQVFRAAGPTQQAQTVTSFCMELGIPCVQLEISTALMDDLGSLQALHANAKLINALAAFITTLEPKR